MQAQLLDIVVVNYNAGDLLGRCLESVLHHPVVATVTLVDNGSTDDSLTHPGVEKVDELIKLPDNPGFATACNRGSARGAADWLVFLNPDAWFEAGALDRLAAALQQDSRAGLYGVEVLDEQGRRQRATIRELPELSSHPEGFFHLFRDQPPIDMDIQPGNAPMAVPAVSGACMVVRRSAFQAIQGFDPGFRLHGEDLDLMRRLKDAGWSIVWLPQVVIRHIQGVSSRSRPVWVHWQKHRSIWRYLRKHELPERSWTVRLLARAGVLLRFFLALPGAVRNR